MLKAIIKAIINSHNMNILHQKSKIKDESNCRNKKYCLLCGKYLLPNIYCQRKITSSQPDYTEKVYFGVAEKYFKDTATPNPLSMRITQSTADRILGN